MDTFILLAWPSCYNKLKIFPMNMDFTSYCWGVWSKTPAWHSHNLRVVMTKSDVTRQHKSLLLPEKKLVEEKSSSLKNTCCFMANIWKSPLRKMEVSKANDQGEGGRGGLHDRQVLLNHGHYFIKLERRFDHWPEHCHHSCSQQTHLSPVLNTPEMSWGSNEKPTTPHLMW